MAKRKKTNTVTRRRRVGAVGGSNVSTFAGVAVGALAARLIASKFLSTMDTKIQSAIQVGAGVFLSMQKNPLVKGAGLGMLGAGVISAGQSFNLISGIPGRPSYLQNEPADIMRNISGGDNLNYLGNPEQSPEFSVIGNPYGQDQFSVISGVDNFVS